MGDNVEKYSVKYGDNIIEFELVRKNVKNINLRIKPDMSIFVSANKSVPTEVIKSFVKDKSSWIIKKLEYFNAVQPEPRNEKEYVSGESFRYLGRQYRLKVEELDEEGVKYFRGFIYLYVKDKDDLERKEKLYNDWLRERADIVFNESVDKMYELVKKYGIPRPKLKIRDMKSRWGSCIVNKDTITINLQLIKAPKFCIDYVVLHELIHFRYRYHDGKFYNFLTSLMPDWEKRKKILDEEIMKEI